MRSGSSLRGLSEGGDHHVRARLGGAGHGRPLAAIPIAAAAKDDDHAPAGTQVHAGRPEHGAQAVGGVGVVHGHGRRFRHHLHSAWNARQPAHGLHGIAERGAEGTAPRHRAGRVVNGELAEHGRQREGPSPPGRQPDAVDSIGPIADALPAHGGRPTDSNDRHGSAAGRQLVGQGAAEGIVHIDHGSVQGTPKELFLGGAVAGHRAVVVKMVPA